MVWACSNLLCGWWQCFRPPCVETRRGKVSIQKRMSRWPRCTRKRRRMLTPMVGIDGQTSSWSWRRRLARLHPSPPEVKKSSKVGRNAEEERPSVLTRSVEREEGGEGNQHGAGSSARSHECCTNSAQGMTLIGQLGCDTCYRTRS